MRAVAEALPRPLPVLLPPTPRASDHAPDIRREASVTAEPVVAQRLTEDPVAPVAIGYTSATASAMAARITRFKTSGAAPPMRTSGRPRLGETMERHGITNPLEATVPSLGKLRGLMSVDVMCQHATAPPPCGAWTRPAF
jgi:hypothetical protein